MLGMRMFAPQSFPISCSKLRTQSSLSIAVLADVGVHDLLVLRTTHLAAFYRQEEQEDVIFQTLQEREPYYGSQEDRLPNLDSMPALSTS